LKFFLGKPTTEIYNSYSEHSLSWAAFEFIIVTLNFLNTARNHSAHGHVDVLLLQDPANGRSHSPRDPIAAE
jgi:hypothetical protein